MLLERPEPRLIYSTSHDSHHRTGVSLPGGAHEREISRAAAAGLSQACRQSGVEFIDLCGEPGDNWSGARQLADIAEKEQRQHLVLELHCNAGWQPGWPRGLMLMHPVEQDVKELEQLLRESVMPRIPPGGWARTVGMPEPREKQRFNWAYLEAMRGRPAVLLELGYIEDPEFVAFLLSVEHQALVGKWVGDAICEWLLRPLT
jgi:N-acetylmuramoyl-L-alanine amidase